MYNQCSTRNACLRYGALGEKVMAMAGSLFVDTVQHYFDSDSDISSISTNSVQDNR